MTSPNDNIPLELYRCDVELLLAALDDYRLNAEKADAMAQARAVHRLIQEQVAQYDADKASERRIADRIDGYDRDDLGESPDF